jgi:glycosyltransferase involved in cell wall biosynthesis
MNDVADSRLTLHDCEDTHARSSHDLWIVIPVHDRRILTRACLDALKHQSVQGFRIIVVDDGSTDGTGDMVEQEFTDVLLLRGDGNLWWSGATNLGVKRAIASGATHVMTLNDDILVGVDFVKKMLENSRTHPSALLGAAAVDALSGQLIYGGERVVWWCAGYKNVLAQLSPQDRNGLHEVTHFPGRGLLIPAEVFEKIGLFDEKHFPHYIADFDFTHRALRHGFKIYCTYDAVVRISPEAIGSLVHRREKGLKRYYTHLFGIKGGGNLWRFLLYGLKNCPVLFLPSFLLVGVARRLMGYPIEWILESFHHNEFVAHENHTVK